MKANPAGQKRAFIYCRTSSDSDEDDGEKVSIETQEADGIALAKRFGYSVLGVFKDRGRSGRLYPTGFELPDKAVERYCNESNYSPNTRTRKEFGKLISRINEIDVIIVRNADRLMRPYALSFLGNHILSILREHNIVIHSHDDNIIDPHNSDNLLIFDIKSSVASRYIVDRQNETKIGMKERRDRGELYFPPNFYGFRTAGHQKVRREEKEIEIIKRVFKEFLAGKTLNAIARDLNTEHIPTLNPYRKDKKEKTYWLDSTIRSMLKRTQYAGYQLKSNGVEEVKVEVYHPPVIDRDTFDKVQLKLKVRKEHKNVGNTKNVHGLTGLVQCGYCGRKLYTTATYTKWGNVKHKIESFRCNTPSMTHEKTECAGIQIRERGTKGLTHKSGQPYSMGLEDCLFPLVYKGYFNHLAEKARRIGLDDEIDTLKVKIEQNISHIKNLNQQMMENPKNTKWFNVTINDAMSVLTLNEQRLAELQKEADSIDRVDIPKDLFTNYSAHQIPNELKRELFKSVIDHVNVYHDYIDVYIKGDKSFTLKRIKSNNTYILPTWRVVEITSKKIIMQDADRGMRKPIHNKIPITADTHLDLVYQYDNDDPIMVIFNDNENIIIMTEGIKKQPDSKK